MVKPIYRGHPNIGECWTAPEAHQPNGLRLSDCPEAHQPNGVLGRSSIYLTLTAIAIVGAGIACA